MICEIHIVNASHRNEKWMRERAGERKNTKEQRENIDMRMRNECNALCWTGVSPACTFFAIGISYLEIWFCFGVCFTFRFYYLTFKMCAYACMRLCICKTVCLHRVNVLEPHFDINVHVHVFLFYINFKHTFQMFHIYFSIF